MGLCLSTPDDSPALNSNDRNQPQAAPGTVTTHIGGIKDKLITSDDTENGRIRNIFAKPMEMLADFIAPVFAKNEEEIEFISDALEGNFVFSDLSKDELIALVNAFETFSVTGGATIIEQGDVGDYFYVIGKGSVNFIVDGRKVGRAEAGGSFGELALLYNCPRAATCVAREDCKLWRVDQRTFRKILASHQIKSENEILALLGNVDIFKGLSSAQMRKIADTLSEKSFKAGEVIFNKGEEGLVFYIVKEGEVVNTEIEVGETKYSDQIQGPGNFFGERALTTGETRAANAIAKTDCKLLCMSRDDFFKYVGPLKELIRKSQYKYRLKGVSVIAKMNLSEEDFDLLSTLLLELKLRPDHTIANIGEKSSAAIYFVVSGSVTRISKRGETATLGSGEYFGEETFGNKFEIVNEYTYRTAEPTVLEKLGLDAAKIVFKNFKESFKSSSSNLDSSITLNSLKKHLILGAGTFGQVWLVSDKKNTDQVYALKIQSKRVVVQHEQYDGVIREKNIMAQIDHPFIIKLVNAFQDPTFLYMVTLLYQGGELFSVIHKGEDKGLPASHAKFYAACIFEGLNYMHQRKILYRDLKPENVLLDSDGYCVIVDLGFAKIVPDKTFTLCGTPLYIAPEVLLQRGHDKGADIWSLGILIFELIIGFTPFYEKGIDQATLFRNISKCKYRLPPSLSHDASSLISSILIRQSSRRIGCRAAGEEDIRNHPWFEGLDFDDLFLKELAAPWKPKIKNPLDSSNFDNWSHLEHEFKHEKPLPKNQQKFFSDF